MGVVIRLRAGRTRNRGSNLAGQGISAYSESYRPTLGHTQSPMQWISRFLSPPRVKQLGRKLPIVPFSAQAENERTCIPPLPNMTEWSAQRQCYIYLLSTCNYRPASARAYRLHSCTSVDKLRIKWPNIKLVGKFLCLTFDLQENKKKKRIGVLSEIRHSTLNTHIFVAVFTTLVSADSSTWWKFYWVSLCTPLMVYLLCSVCVFMLLQ